MRRFALLLCVPLVGMAWLGVARAVAQVPPRLADGAAVMPSDLPAPPGVQMTDGTEVLWDARPGKAWGVDLVLGFPSGIRVFHELGTPGGWAPQLEGFAGLYLFFPTAGVGLRWQWAPLHGERDGLCLRPGADLYVWGNPFHDGGWFLFDGQRAWAVPAADVDIVWQHCFDHRWAGELGIKLGAGAVLHGRSVFGRSAFPVPLGAVFLGFHY